MQDKAKKPEKPSQAFTVSISQIPVSTAVCPQSGSRGKRVDSLTLKAMLAVSLSELRDSHYFFCKDADCPIVYFSEDGKQSFTTEQIRESVYQKDAQNDAVFLCYCFRHTVGTVRAETHSGREAPIIESINAAIQAGHCACDIRNPQGSCCLGNVQAFIKQIKEKQPAKDESARSIESKEQD
jgi:hypothetical protein